MEKRGVTEMVELCYGIMNVTVWMCFQILLSLLYPYMGMWYIIDLF